MRLIRAIALLHKPSSAKFLPSLHSLIPYRIKTESISLLTADCTSDLIRINLSCSSLSLSSIGASIWESSSSAGVTERTSAIFIRDLSLTHVRQPSMSLMVWAERPARSASFSCVRRNRFRWNFMLEERILLKSFCVMFKTIMVKASIFHLTIPSFNYYY